jgi:hypothetical protein
MTRLRTTATPGLHDLGGGVCARDGDTVLCLPGGMPHASHSRKAPDGDAVLCLSGMLVPFKNSPQCLHLMASWRISSAQYGHFLVGGGAGAGGGVPERRISRKYWGETATTPPVEGGAAAAGSACCCAWEGTVRLCPHFGFGHSTTEPAPASSITICCPHQPQLNEMSIVSLLSLAVARCRSLQFDSFHRKAQQFIVGGDSSTIIDTFALMVAFPQSAGRHFFV